MDANERVGNTGGERVTTEDLRADLKVLAADMERLLEATANRTGCQVVQARNMAQDTLRAGRARVASMQSAAIAGMRSAGQETNDYVHANPWPVIAACAVAGVAIGALLAHDERTQS